MFEIDSTWLCGIIQILAYHSLTLLQKNIKGRTELIEQRVFERLTQGVWKTSDGAHAH